MIDETGNRLVLVQFHFWGSGGTYRSGKSNS